MGENDDNELKMIVSLEINDLACFQLVCTENP